MQFLFVNSSDGVGKSEQACALWQNSRGQEAEAVADSPFQRPIQQRIHFLPIVEQLCP